MENNDASIHVVNIIGEDGFVRGYVEQRESSLIVTVNGDMLDGVLSFHVEEVIGLQSQDYVIAALTEVLGQVKTLSVMEGSRCFVEKFEPTTAYSTNISGVHYEDEK